MSVGFLYNKQKRSKIDKQVNMYTKIFYKNSLKVCKNHKLPEKEKNSQTIKKKKNVKFWKKT